MSDGNVSGEDPYGELLDSEKEGVRPDFLKNDSWGDGVAYRLNGDDYDKDDKKIKRKSRRIDAGLKLADAEKDASSGGIGQDKNGLNSARKKESSGGLYSGISGFTKGKSKNKKKDIKGVLKKATPLVGIVGAFTGAIMFISAGQNMLPLAIKELLTEKLNSICTSSTVASDDWLDTQLSQGVRSGAPKKDEPSTMYAFSDYQVQQFENQGLKVVHDGDITAFLYEKDGQYIPVVSNDTSSNHSESEIINTIQSVSGVNDIGSPVSAKEALADQSFKNPYTTATKPWRCGVSGWFDNIMSDITEAKLSITRNRWSKYVAGSIKDAAKSLEDFKATAENSKAINGTKDDGVDSDFAYKDENGNTYSKSQVTEDGDGGYVVKQDDGTKIKVTAIADDGSDSFGSIKNWAKNASDSDTFKKINDVLNSKIAKVGTKATEAACLVIEGMVTIYTVVSAYQSIQFLNLITGFLESVDKVKAGDGSGSPINEYGANLTAKSDTVDNNKGGVGSKGEVVREGRTSVESAGMANLFLNSKVDPNDASVQNVNFESIMANISTLTSNIKLTAGVYEACGYARVALAAADLVTTIVSFIPIIGQGVKAIQVSGKAIAKAVVQGLAGLAFKILVPIIARRIANLIIKNAATEWFGEDLGNAIYSGASKYLGGNGTSGGQSPGSKSKVLAYLGQRDAVIAEEAKYQRSIRSPFDVTSRHTFLGSLAYSIIPFAYSGGVMSKLTQFSSLTSSFAVGMLPTATAIGENSELSSEGRCDLLITTGAVGDAFCNPYIITDMSTIATSPIAVDNIVHGLGTDTEIASVDSKVRSLSDNFDDNGKIKNDSNLSRYITFCGQRTSPYGLKDATIAAQVSGENTTVSKIIGYIPVANDVADIVNGSKGLANLDWATGEKCVAAEDSKDWEDQYKWYQRYTENERLLENINPGYVSEVTAYLRNYYNENPLDQSFEGTLARFSGQTKEKVGGVLAWINYMDFLSEYDPSERYVFGEPVKEQKDIKFNDNNSVANDGLFTLINCISYADVRNRNFAA